MTYRIGRSEPDTVQIFIKVTPNAAEDAVGAVERQADDTLRLAVRVRATPENGAANTAVIKLLSRHFGISKSALRMSHGQQGRLKTIVAPDSEALRAQLEALV
ncbi:MAG: DUF167 domain-containing protein [Pseudomonadota bacterium]